jgi:hypothetical protein
MRRKYWTSDKLILVRSDAGDGGGLCTPHGRLPTKSPAAMNRRCKAAPRITRRTVNGHGRIGSTMREP